MSRFIVARHGSVPVSKQWIGTTRRGTTDMSRLRNVQIMQSATIYRTPRRRPDQRALVELAPQTVFAAVEHGSAWTNEWSKDVHGRICLQEPSEAPGQFARRIGFELMRLSAAPFEPHGVVIQVLAPGIADAQIEARCAIAKALVRCFANADVAVVLLCGERASGDERAHALAIAEGLSDGRRGKEVVVRFFDAAVGIRAGAA
jgi:hypothetical protein